MKIGYIVWNTILSCLVLLLFLIYGSIYLQNQKILFNQIKIAQFITMKTQSVSDNTKSISDNTKILKKFYPKEFEKKLKREKN